RGVTSLAMLAVVASFGCTKPRRTYPTINAVAPDGGGARIHGQYNHCPVVVFVASPDHASVGQPVSLTATASDEDGDPITYAWMASSGTISDANAPMTTFTCTKNGSIEITLTVADDSCSTVISGPFLCQPAEDGGVSDGGSAGASGTGGTAGGSPTGTGGSTGGNGSMGTGGMAGTGTAGSMGSAGRGGSGGAAGTTGSGGGGGTACMETNIPQAQAAACATCIAAFQTGIEGCCTIQTSDPTGYSLCQTVSACMRSGTCNAMGDTQSCYCGTRPGTCDQAGQANGPCVSEVTAAAGRNVVLKKTDSPTPANVLTRYGDTDYALGRASQVHLIAGGFCANECSIGM
ncbi:MAG TPA: PKD domain-containing protein, partial [Polyangia bacterium]|nr:PKD domain-containing protein [Polyangia bacterium]